MSKAMTATNAPTSSTELSAEQKAHEPSMDDILTSIRRLISDDDALPISRRARASARTRAPSVDAPPEPEGEAGAPPKDAFFGLVHRLGRHSSPAAPEAAVSAPTGAHGEPGESEPRQEASVSPPPASVIAKTPALKLRDFALKNFVSRPEPTPPVEAEPAARVETPAATEAALSAAALRPSLPAEDQPAPAAPTTPAPVTHAPPFSSVVSLPTRPAPAVEARTKIAPLPLRAPAAETVSEKPQEAPREAPQEPTLLSAAADAKIGASFEALTESLLARDKDLLDRTARELLRPMLKDWLNDNLPGLVERLVRAEIERIARGRG
jgi:cell pole-organizing protein PopZ